MLRRANGRLRQGLRALRAWVRPPQDAIAQAYLAPALFALYRQMRRGERQHSLNVLQTLRARGADHPALLTAALLHDVGKTRAPFFLPERVIVVLAKAFLPAGAARWGRGDSPRGWRRPFVVSAQHPAWGARMAAEAGADPLVVALIAAHQTDPAQVQDSRLASPEAKRFLALLQAADEMN